MSAWVTAVQIMASVQTWWKGTSVTVNLVTVEKCVSSLTTHATGQCLIKV